MLKTAGRYRPSWWSATNAHPYQNLPSELQYKILLFTFQDDIKPLNNVYATTTGDPPIPIVLTPVRVRGRAFCEHFYAYNTLTNILAWARWLIAHHPECHEPMLAVGQTIRNIMTDRVHALGTGRCPRMPLRLIWQKLRRQHSRPERYDGCMPYCLSTLYYNFCRSLIWIGSRSWRRLIGSCMMLGRHLVFVVLDRCALVIRVEKSRLGQALWKRSDL